MCPQEQDVLCGLAEPSGSRLQCLHVLQPLASGCVLLAGVPGNAFSMSCSTRWR